VLQPGDYQSTNIDLFGTGRPGQLSYTVPQGWANTLDHQPAYWLRPAVDYAADDSYDGNETTSGIYVWGDVAAARQGSSCAEWSDETVDTDPTSLSAWMAGLPGLVVTPPTAGTIDGKSLVEFDIMLDAEVAPLCPWGRFVPLLAGRPGAEDSYMWGIGAGEQMRMRIIDLGDGHTASVIIDGPAEVFDELLQMSEPVIDSLRFSPGT
jgi:hypothetical protein